MDAKSPRGQHGAGLTKGERTRRRIAAVAAPLFNQRGFAGCSMHDIQSAAGLQKGGLYRHFDTKEELAAAALCHSLRELKGQRFTIPDDVTGALDRLRALVHAFVHIPSPIPGGCPLLNTAVDADDGNASLRAIALEGFREWHRRLEAIIRRGMRSGELRPDLVPHRLATVIISTLEGALVLARLERSRRPLLDSQEHLEQVLLSLSAPPSSQRTPVRRSRKPAA